MRKVYVIGKILTIRLYMLMCMALLCIGCEAENEDFPILFKSSSKLHEPYGLCTHINRKGEGWEFDCKDKDMEMAREIGTNFVRTDFDWGYCQPQKDKPFTFIHHQEMMNVVESRQLKMLGIFSTWLLSVAGLISVFPCLFDIGQPIVNVFRSSIYCIEVFFL